MKEKWPNDTFAREARAHVDTRLKRKWARRKEAKSPFKPYEVDIVSEFGVNGTMFIPARSPTEAAKLFAKSEGTPAPGKGRYVNPATGHVFKIKATEQDPWLMLHIKPAEGVEKEEQVLGLDPKGHRLGELVTKRFSTTSPPAFVTNTYVVTGKGKGELRGKILGSNVNEMTSADVY